MNTSVIICSYNPSQHLTYTLDSLLPQSKEIFQVVVVIDNNKYADYANTVITKYKNLFNLFTVHIQPNSGRAAARNTGAKLANGGLLLFLDDDMIAEEGLVKKHQEYQSANKDSIIIGNGYRNPVYARDDFSKYLIEVERSWAPKDEGKIDVKYSNFIFTACNMSISKNLFDGLNGFDARLKDGEDFDFGVRAIKQGVSIIYDKALMAWHNDWPDIRSFIDRQNEYNKGKMELFKIHPEYVEYFPQMLPGKISIIKKFMYVLIKSPIIWLVTTGSNIFTYLPDSTKFKMYNLAVASGTSRSIK